MNKPLTDHEKSCLLQAAAAVQNELNEALAQDNAARILHLVSTVFGETSNVTKTIDWIVPPDERHEPELAVAIFTLENELRYVFANSSRVSVEFLEFEGDDDETRTGVEERLLQLQENSARARYGWRELLVKPDDARRKIGESNEHH